MQQVKSLDLNMNIGEETMFLGRQKELSALNKLYHSDKFQFAVVYGRRRIGKTALISQFIKDKKAIYFTGVETNEKQNLENFSRNILGYEKSIDVDTCFLSFQSALEYTFELAKKEKLVLVIDEYPYVARTSKSLASTLQLLIDQYKDNSNMFLILCGSSMSYMEDNVLAYKAPLYGRRTAQFKIQPFEFRDVCEYFKNLSDVDKALAYGMLGGTPQYMLQIDDTLSIEDNIKNIFLSPTSFIFEEPTNLLKQEVREAAIYNAIITAIATGYTKMSEISSKVGEESSVCATYIKNLLSLGIVKKELPFNEKTTRKTIYSLEDNMFRFWYRFIPSNLSIISRGATELAYNRIKPHLSDYMGSIFEEICKQYLWHQLLVGNCPVNFCDIGRWWGNNPKTKKQEEIDILGVADNNSALFSECKWINEKVDLSVLETLIKRSELLHYHEKHYYLFAKNGFTKGCIDRASELSNVTLITYAEMMK